MSKHIQPPEVHCPAPGCGIKITLNADGTIPHHTIDVTGEPARIGGPPSQFTRPCDGVGRKAAKEKVA